MFEIDSTNGLRTKMFQQHGRLITKAYCLTKTNKELAYYFPVESAYIWYPLFSYYNYYYVPTYNDILLVVDDKAPEFVKNKLAHKHIHLKNLYDYATGKPKLKDNLIMNVNLGLEGKFQQEGLVTWSQNYTTKDLENNQKIINNTLDFINENILRRQEKHEYLAEHQINGNSYNYADKKELSKLSELGCAINMNNYMLKVEKAKLG